MKIGVIALGLIGGSIYKGLKKKGYEVIGVSRSIKEASKNINDVKDCDVVFVCTPMNKTLETLDKLENILNPKTIVLDICSLKEFVCEKQRPYYFIGSHPMAGKETSGFDSSNENLFEGATWVLTEHNKIIEKIIDDLGAKVIIAEPKEHDKAAALISHMPMLISQAIMKTALDNKLALALASSGFRDMTRLSMTNVEMAKDMINLNSENIESALIKLYNSIKCLKNTDYGENIENIKQLRESMYNADGKNQTTYL